MESDDAEKSVNAKESILKIVKAVDLISRVEKEPKPVVLWDKIPEGSIGLITGVAKTGKTTFAENLAIALSVGKREFFGKPLNGKPRKVLFINLEEGYRIRSRRNKKQIAVLSKEEYDLFCENYISTPIDFPEFINKEDDWELISEYIKLSEAEIIFMDSLTHMFSGKIEDSQTCQKFIQKLQKYLVSLGKTVIVIHHNTKGNDKPINQDNIAGSRVILQYFQFAYGFANIPTARGGSYMSMLNNKYFEKDDILATLYTVTENNWFKNLGEENKFNLYKEVKPQRVDGRTDSVKKDLIYNYFTSQSSLDSQDGTILKSSELMTKFVSTGTMSKDTLYIKLGTLLVENKIEKNKKDGVEIKGEYKLKGNIDDEARAQ